MSCGANYRTKPSSNTRCRSCNSTSTSSRISCRRWNGGDSKTPPPPGEPLQHLHRARDSRGSPDHRHPPCHRNAHLPAMRPHLLVITGKIAALSRTEDNCSSGPRHRSPTGRWPLMEHAPPGSCEEREYVCQVASRASSTELASPKPSCSPSRVITMRSKCSSKR
jgi:hypothetical protein